MRLVQLDLIEIYEAAGFHTCKHGNVLAHMLVY